MNSWLHPGRRKLHQGRCYLFAALLLATSGCGLLQNEQEGDQEPKQGEYRVTITPSDVTLTPESHTARVTASVECGGQSPPDDCAANPPMWSSPAVGSILKVNIADPRAQSTTVDLDLDFVALLQANPKINSSLGFDEFKILGITPTRIPEGLRVTGRPFVGLRLLLPPPGGSRTEEPAIKPSLAAYPGNGLLPRSGKTGPISGFFRVKYKGPATQVISITKGGAHPDRFAVFGPGTPFPVDKSATFSVSVTFNGAPASDRSEYRITVTIGTANLAATDFPIVCGP